MDPLKRLWAHITATVLLGTGFVIALVLAFPANAQPSPVTVITGPDDQIAEFVAAVQSVANQYATAPFTITTGTELNGQPLADNRYVGANPGILMFNKKYSVDPALVERAFAYDVSMNYHSPGCSAQTYLGIHEAAHQIDYTHGMRARQAALDWAAHTSAEASDLSGYSFNDYGYFVPAEALAEAFAAVKCDPAGSTPAEYDLYNILVTTQ